MIDTYKCCKCKKDIDSYETMEYRGFYSCEGCFEEVVEKVDSKRKRIIEDQEIKTSPLKGLDLREDSIIGKANRELLKVRIEICEKETVAEKEYRQGKL